LAQAKVCLTFEARSLNSLKRHKLFLKNMEFSVLTQEIIEKTKKTASLYFKDVEGEKPFELWKAFDKDLAKDLSLFITGQMYAREKIPHETRQLVTVAALTVLSRLDELKLHIQAALNVGCTPQDIAEVIFQTAVYGGVPATNQALKTLRSVLQEKGMWPPG
jgi:4-carboxymuconolactone decarboxylase